MCRAGLGHNVHGLGSDIVHAAMQWRVVINNCTYFFFLSVKSGDATAPPAPVLPVRLSQMIVISICNSMDVSHRATDLTDSSGFWTDSIYRDIHCQSIQCHQGSIRCQAVVIHQDQELFVLEQHWNIHYQSCRLVSQIQEATTRAMSEKSCWSSQIIGTKKNKPKQAGWT